MYDWVGGGGGGDMEGKVKVVEEKRQMISGKAFG